MNYVINNKSTKLTTTNNDATKELINITTTPIIKLIKLCCCQMPYNEEISRLAIRFSQQLVSDFPC